MALEIVVKPGQQFTMSDFLNIRKQPNGVVTITFNRPDARNALDLATMRAFANIIDVITNDASVRVVILTGAGETAFCSGGDLVELSRYPAEHDAVNFITIMGDALRKLELLPVPVIAAINGYALGGGSEIAVACDLRIVDENVRIGFVQINLALTPGWGAGQRLLRLVGYTQAMDVLLTGRVLQAEELQSMGLVNRVVEAGTALEHALHYAERLVAHPPEVVHGIKALLRAGLNQSYNDAMNFERSLFPPLWAAEPHLQAVKRFLKRQNDKGDA